MHGIQVADGDVLQRVLQGVEGGRDGEFPSVAGEDGGVEVVEKNGDGGGGGEGQGDVVERDGEGDGELDDLVEEDGGRGEVAGGAVEGHDARVVHYLSLDVSNVRSMAGISASLLWGGDGEATYEDQRRVLEHELASEQSQQSGARAGGRARRAHGDQRNMLHGNAIEGGAPRPLGQPHAGLFSQCNAAIGQRSCRADSVNQASFVLDRVPLVVAAAKHEQHNGNGSSVPFRFPFPFPCPFLALSSSLSQSKAEIQGRSQHRKDSRSSVSRQ